LITPAERSFFGVLHQALASDYHLFVKVRLADIVRPVQGPSRSGRQAAFNRISSKHVDFVLCDLALLKVVGVIELDDSTHERFERGIRDGFVDSALTTAGIPVLRFSARHSYPLAQIREQVLKAFGSEQKAA
jgi:very-short-patch-repair endonuclease